MLNMQTIYMLAFLCLILCKCWLLIINLLIPAVHVKEKWESVFGQFGSYLKTFNVFLIAVGQTYYQQKSTGEQI